MRQAFLIAAVLVYARTAAAQMSTQQMVDVLKKIDEVMTCPTDFKSTILLKQVSSDNTEKVWQMVRYRRDSDASLVLMADKPHTEAGKGYLRTSNNLWFYDPNTGKWERRSEDRSLFARSSRRRDFDVWRVADEYDPTYIGKEKVGNTPTEHIKLTVKKGVAGPTDFPVWDVWLVPETGLPAKIDQYAESGKLVRSMFLVKWTSKKAKGKEFIQPQEMRVFDQVDKGTRLTMLLQDLNFDPIDPSIFTKAWMEAHSR